MTHLENFGNRIKQRRLSLDMTQTELAKLSGYTSRSSINKIELGLIDIPQSKIVAIAKALQCSPAYLVGAEEQMQNKEIDELPKNAIQANTIIMPIIGSIAAGYDFEAITDYEGEIAVPTNLIRTGNPSDYFVLRVNGDSMYPKFIEGDKVLVFKTPSVDSGTISVIGYNGYDATLKIVKYKTGEDWLDLIPINPEYPTKRIAGPDLEECRVYGKVVYLFREI